MIASNIIRQILVEINRPYPYGLTTYQFKQVDQQILEFCGRRVTICGDLLDVSINSIDLYTRFTYPGYDYDGRLERQNLKIHTKGIDFKIDSKPLSKAFLMSITKQDIFEVEGTITNIEWDRKSEKKGSYLRISIHPLTVTKIAQNWMTKEHFGISSEPNDRLKAYWETQRENSQIERSNEIKGSILSFVLATLIIAATVYITTDWSRLIPKISIALGLLFVYTGVNGIRKANN